MVIKKNQSSNSTKKTFTHFHSVICCAYSKGVNFLFLFKTHISSVTAAPSLMIK